MEPMELRTKKKILFLITKSNWGGAQKYVFDLASSLPQDRFESVVVYGGKGPLGEKLASAGIRTIEVASLERDIDLIKEAKSLFELISIIKTEKPHVVHVNSSKAGGLGAFAARVARVPHIVFTCHGWAFNEDRPGTSLLLIRFFSWLTVALCHTTIAVSARDLYDGQKMPFVGNKMTLIHNGVREPGFLIRSEAKKSLAALAREKGVKISKTSILVGAIGELHKNKGYEHLLYAFAKLKNEISHPLALIILGEGEERQGLEKLVLELGLSGEVALLGFVNDAPSYLHAFDAFALTSIKEGLPYAVIEAGFAGLPVVATNVGGVREIIDDLRSGVLVQTRKPDDIAQGLKLILLEPEKAEAFGKALKMKTRAEFSIERMTQKTAALYELH